MSYIPSSEFYLKVVQGLVPGYSVVHKFGRNADVGTSLEPITASGVYQTPTSATSLEIVSSNTNDTTGESGAQKVLIQGLDANFSLSTEEVTMNGTTAVDLSKQYTRIFRAYVSQTGTYATQTAGSHAGTLTIREDGGGSEWARIDLQNSFPGGQTEIGCYTIPAGYTAYVLDQDVFVDANQSGSVIFFQRPNADDVSAPYTGAMRIIDEWIGISGSATRSPKTPRGPFVGPCDIGFMGLVTGGSGDIVVDMELLIVQNTA